MSLYRCILTSWNVNNMIQDVLENEENESSVFSGIDVDFSLAINNKTGKFYLGQDIIHALSGLVGQTYFGRLRSVSKSDILRRIHGRLFQWENLSRISKCCSQFLPLQKNKNPVLHIDPLTVINHELKSTDIVLCHDVGPITHPQYFAPQTEALYQKAYQQIMQKKCHVVFVSEHTRAEFQRIYGSDFATCEVIYIPVRAELTYQIDVVKDKVAPYFLTVGSLGSRKNQVKSIEGFKISGLHEQGYEYLLVGSKEPGSEEVIELAEATSGVRVLGYVDDEQLKQLYRQTAGFVLMSHLEGFGMPVVEAAQYGAPCLVSAGGIFAEIGGPSMLTADPNCVHSIADQMLIMASLSGEERKLLANQAIDHIQLFDESKIYNQWRDLVSHILIGI